WIELPGWSSACASSRTPQASCPSMKARRTSIALVTELLTSLAPALRRRCFMLQLSLLAATAGNHPFLPRAAAPAQGPGWARFYRCGGGGIGYHHSFNGVERKGEGARDRPRNRLSNRHRR